MKKLIPLIALFAALLALTAYRESLRPTSASLDVEADLRPVALSRFTAEDVTAVHVTGPGGSAPSYSVTRSGDAWVVDQPFRAPAAAGAVNRLIEAVTAAEGEQRSPDDAFHDAFHLTPATRTAVKIEGEGGTTLAHFGVGRSSGRSGAFVALLGPDQDAGAYAVTSDLRTALGLTRTPVGDAAPESPSAKAFQDSNFPPFQFTDVKQLALTTPRHQFVFEQSARVWSTVSGGPGGGIEVGMGAVDKIVNQFGGALKPSGLIDPARRDELGLANPTHKLILTVGDNQTRGVVGVIHEAEDGATTHAVELTVAQDPPVVYEVSPSGFEKLFPSGGSLYKLVGSDLDPRRIGRIAIDHPDGRLVLERVSGNFDADWKIVEPTWPLPVRQDALRNLARSVAGMRPADWIEGRGPDELADADFQVRYGPYGAADEELMRMAFGGEAPGGGRLATLPSQPRALLVVEDSGVDALVPDIFSLHESKLLQGWDDRLLLTIEVERVTDGARSRDYVATSKSTGWQIHGGGDPRDAELDAVNDWLKRLKTVRVTRQLDAGEGAAPEAWVTLKRQIGEPMSFGVSAPDDAGQVTITVGEMRFAGEASDAAPASDTLLPKSEEDSGADEGSDTPDDTEDPDEGDGGDDE